MEGFHLPGPRHHGYEKSHRLRRPSPPEVAIAPTITTAERRARLVARHHLGRTAPTLHDAVDGLFAVHSSDPLTPHLGLWARVGRYLPEDLDAAFLDEPSLARLHAMRRTLWIVRIGDRSMLDAAVGRKIAAAERKRVHGWLETAGHDPAAFLARFEARAIELIEAHPGVFTRDLTEMAPELATRVVLGQGKWAREAPIASRLLFMLAMDGEIARTAPSGSWKTSQYGWRRATPLQSVPPTEARASLVSSYLRAFGPVTETDVKWWSGLTVTQTRAALAKVGREVELERGAQAWDAADGEAPPEAQGPSTAPAEQPVATLLPGLDPTPMGYKERGWFLGDHEAALFDRNGNIGPTIWVDGRIVGGWAVTADGTVATRLLEDPGRAATSAVQAEAEALTAWLDGTSVTPRFRTPLERELAA